MFRHIFIIFYLILFTNTSIASCGDEGVWLQVLGAGGPEVSDQLASSGYLIWQDGKAKILVDIGSGSMFHFEKSGAKINDLDVILLTHLHVDHSADLPALVKASFFTNRSKNLPIFGPSGNAIMPSTTAFLTSLFGPKGAYRYLSSYLDGSDRYKIQATDVNIANKQEKTVLTTDAYQIVAVPTNHGPIPSLAWKITVANKILVFSGDMSNENHTLTHLANHADILIAHHAIPEESKGTARRLHMPPSIIGQIAAQSNVNQLVLSHHMVRTLDKTKISKALIRKHYAGPINFAKDLQCFKP